MTSSSGGGRITSLTSLLEQLDPRLRDGEWVFVTSAGVPEGTTALAMFEEDEGTSLVLRRDEADRVGLRYDVVHAWITLGVHSALDAVGLTAAVAGCLAGANISCNVVAARFHDHLFVPHVDSARALALLRALRPR